MSDKYAVIAAHRQVFPIVLMCRVLEVSPAGFYAAQARPPAPRVHADVQLRATIRTTFQRCHGRYGSPRRHRVLQAAGETVSVNRVARLMRDEGCVARTRRRFVTTTDSAHVDPIAPNVVARAFAVGDAVNTTWVSDTTFVPTRAGWLYLAVVLDLASRLVVGWATSAHNDAALVSAALSRVIAFRAPAPGLVQHSDRGSTYASGAYQTILHDRRMIASMSRKGDCWDNAVAESFFATLEWELLAQHDFVTHAAATRALVDFIDTWYNRDRMHSSLDYRSPMAYEQDLRRLARAA